MRRRIGVLAAALALAAGLSVPAGNAQPHLLVGIQDDAQTLYGNPTTTFPILRQLRTQIVRVNLNWGGKFGVATKRRPAHPQDPADPAYDWTLYDRSVRYASQNGIQVLFTILFTPKWANGNKAQKVPPRNYGDLRNFAYAAAERYSGHYIPVDDTGDELPLPAVKHWLAWNEPNNPNWLQQTSGRRFVSPRSYASICNAIFTGVHFTNFANEKVACGATGPRGNNNARDRKRPSMSPLAFMRAARRAGMRRMDAYAHHPYYGRPSETPATNPGGTAVTLGNISTLIRESNRLFGKKPIWITEYGFQTPPDRQFGISLSRQKKYVSQAYRIAWRTPQIAMMVWFMLKDDTNIGNGWQSGFLTARGKRKPSFTAFARLPH